MINITYKMGQTLERLDLYDSKEWYIKKIIMMLSNVDEELSNVGEIGQWSGIDRQIREAEEETQRQASGKGILRLGGSDRPINWRDDKAES